jgi:hypothetical protein
MPRDPTAGCVLPNAGLRTGMAGMLKSDSDANAAKGRGLRRHLAAIPEWVQVAMAPPRRLEPLEQRE